MEDKTPSNSQDRELLGRLDERTKAIQSGIEKMNFDIRMQIEHLSKKIDDSESRLEKRINNIESDINDNYVTKEQLSPIAKIVYGVVGLIITAVFSALVAVVVIKPAAIPAA